MTEEQKNFLTELHELFKKYEITVAFFYRNKIRFYRKNCESLSVDKYENGTFLEIETTQSLFKP